MFSLESWVQCSGFGILAMKSWPWNLEGGILAAESWLSSPGCGILAVGGLGLVVLVAAVAMAGFWAWLACVAGGCTVLVG